MVVGGTVLFMTLFIESRRPYYKRFFVEQDSRYSHPIMEQTVTVGMLFLVSTLIPFLAITVVSYTGALGKRMQLGTLQKAFWSGIVVQFACISCLKYLVGRLRPNFFALCDYQGYGKIDFSSLPNEAMTTYLSITESGRPGNYDLCLNQESSEGHLSFPSGHSSFSFCGLGFMGMVLAAAAKRHGAPESLQWLLLVLPLTAAGYVAATRVRDYWHHESDVLAGGIIGLAGAYLAFQVIRPEIEAKDEDQADVELKDASEA